MIYSNDDPMAILAMEIARTDNYGEYDSYDGETECPVCGAFEPEMRKFVWRIHLKRRSFWVSITECSEVRAKAEAVML